MTLLGQLREVSWTVIIKLLNFSSTLNFARVSYDRNELVFVSPVRQTMSTLHRIVLSAFIAFATLSLSMSAAEKAFPPTEPGEIEIKTLPSGRVLESSGNGDYFSESGRLFSPLFRYIQQNGIAMTTPVEAQISPGKMYFWVAENQVDKAQKDSANVKVIDVPSRRVASIGAHGAYTQANFEEAKKALLKWIEKEGVETEGEPYGVYWNGPFTPWFLKTFEVHVRLQ